MRELAEQLKGAGNLLFFGRGYNYATALEAALKVGPRAGGRGGSGRVGTRRGEAERGSGGMPFGFGTMAGMRELALYFKAGSAKIFQVLMWRGRAFFCQPETGYVTRIRHVVVAVGCVAGEGGGHHPQRGHPGGRDEARPAGAGGQTHAHRRHRHAVRRRARKRGGCGGAMTGGEQAPREFAI